jgi:hypothetical protein
MSQSNRFPWAEAHLSPRHGKDGGLTAFVLSDDHAFAAFAANKFFSQPGFYVATNNAGKTYVGYGGDLRHRTLRYTTGLTQPARLICIVGQSRPLSPEEAAALERMIAQVLWPYANLDKNDDYPLGGRVDLGTYSSLHAAWSSVALNFRECAPELARPWLGPDYAHLPAPNLDLTRYGGRRIAKRKNICASVIPTTGGYIIEAGSLIRLEPRDRKHLLSYTHRLESLFAGLLVREHDALRLIRPIFRETLASCSRFVFDTSDTAAWQPVPRHFPDSPTM